MSLVLFIKDYKRLAYFTSGYFRSTSGFHLSFEASDL